MTSLYQLSQGVITLEISVFLHTFLWRGLTCPVQGWARLSDRGMRVWGGTADRPSVAWEGCPASPSRAESLST